VADPKAYGALKTALSGSGIESQPAPRRSAMRPRAGRSGDGCDRPARWSESHPAALPSGATVAFANKECLVCGRPADAGRSGETWHTTVAGR